MKRPVVEAPLDIRECALDALRRYVKPRIARRAQEQKLPARHRQIRIEDPLGIKILRAHVPPAADVFRKSVRDKECACPLANASYTNLLLDAPSLARVSANMAGIGS